VQNHRRRSVLLVSHEGTIRLLVSSLMGFDARGYRDRLDQSPGALNILVKTWAVKDGSGAASVRQSARAL
nr:histidine phosphatase family protein [Gammaproteobacteria bacterium]